MATDEMSTLTQVSEELAAAVERAGESTVTVYARRRIPASGVVWSDDGLIVTSDHVLEREEEITVALPDGQEADAQLVGRDPGSDLAVLRVSEQQLRAAERAPQDATKVGHIVLAVGRPGRDGVQASIGAVSAVGGPWRGRRGRRIAGYLRSDTTFYPGFSGGPLVDTRGRVAGINSSHFRRGEGLTIVSTAVDEIVEALVSHGRIQRAYIGIGSQITRLPAALAEKAGGQDTALLIVSVEEDSPASRAALLVGDILTAIGGDPVPDTEELQAALGPERVGATMQLSVLRGGEPQELSVTLVERE